MQSFRNSRRAGSRPPAAARVARFATGLVALAAALALNLGAAAQAQPPPDGRPSMAARVALNAQGDPRSAPPAQAPAASRATGRSAWRAPLAGLAAGLGLASLAGRLGLGAAVAPILMLMLFGAIATALVVVLAARRYRTPSGAALSDGWQGIGGPSYAPRPKTVRITEPREPTLRPGGSPLSDGPRMVVRAPFGVPDDFDTPVFLASAKRSFVCLQSAWDRAELNELGECATDEMFDALAHELRIRAGPSRTDIITLEASLLGIESGRGDLLASVRFSGVLRVNGQDERLDEVWNLSRPSDGSGRWLLAGIQQLN
jgi:predicted lipid-binding transport protein (Tim44 family)